TAAQTQAIAHLASGKSLSATARELGIHRATLHNWFHNAIFSQAYKEASQAAAEAISDEMHALSRLALDTLRHLLTDPKSSPTVKLKASLAVLNHEAGTRNGSWALPFPTRAPRLDPPPSRSQGDLGALTHALLRDPAFLARHAPQMQEKMSINPTQFNPTQLHPKRK
ncbi:MAG: helix-turn-helix domain-containing protein, partial [Acidobacteriota bacterium]